MLWRCLIRAARVWRLPATQLPIDCTTRYPLSTIHSPQSAIRYLYQQSAVHYSQSVIRCPQSQSVAAIRYSLPDYSTIQLIKLLTEVRYAQSAIHYRCPPTRYPLPDYSATGLIPRAFLFSLWPKLVPRRWTTHLQILGLGPSVKALDQFEHLNQQDCTVSPSSWPLP